MVKTSSESAGTMRATSTMSEGAQTMIEHNSTMLESDLGTMVINSDDDEEEDGTMKSMLLIYFCFNNVLCFLMLHEKVVSSMAFNHQVLWLKQGERGICRSVFSIVCGEQVTVVGDSMQKPSFGALLSLSRGL